MVIISFRKEKGGMNKLITHNLLFTIFRIHSFILISLALGTSTIVRIKPNKKSPKKNRNSQEWINEEAKKPLVLISRKSCLLARKT
jgi:hypothetical protein